MLLSLLLKAVVIRHEDKKPKGQKEIDILLTLESG